MLKWGIIGPGAIAKTFALALNSADNCCAYGVAGRDAERAQKFALENNVEKSFDSIDSLLECEEIEAVYVAVPHTAHKEVTCKALEHGKHVLCEKPMALSFEDTATMIRTAKQMKKVLLEGFMYRFHPQTAELVHLIRSGSIGRIFSLEAVMSFAGRYDRSHRLWQASKGGGALWDIGVYPVSMSNLVAAAANRCRFLEPDRIIGTAEFLLDGVDLRAAGIFHYPNGIISRLSCSIAVDEGNYVKIHGESGQITLKNPWVANREKAEVGEILIERTGCEPELIKINSTLTSFEYEAIYFTELVEGLRYVADFPIMTNEESLFQVACMERWFSEASLCPSINDND